ncbi:MAG: ABC transporter substrate-binding protein [Phycisphaerae bacterium]|nr:ABC transporter substrate-binding protein [Phycisphaerae bacterium]MDW8262732.1 ABC transporter substrate-binding protein [Phycisphaerales bacterium]
MLARRGLLILLLLLGCPFGGCERPPAGKTSSEVRLGYFANVTHAQALLGVANGDFQAAIAPAQLRPKVFNAGPALVQALFAGEIDIAYVGPGPALNAFLRSRGREIRVISGAAADGVVIVARKDCAIRSLDDLPGHRIATPQVGNTQDLAAKTFLRRLGHPDWRSAVIPVPNAEQSTLMARKEIDAVWVPEPWGAVLLAEGHRLIAEEKHLWPEGTFSLTLLIASPRFLQQHPETARRIVAVHRTWTQRLQADPQAYATALSDALFTLTSKRLSARVISDSLTRVRFTDDPLPATLTEMLARVGELGYGRTTPALQGLLQPIDPPARMD